MHVWTCCWKFRCLEFKICYNAYDDANELACDITRKYEAYYDGVDTFFKIQNNKILDIEFHQDTDWNKVLNSKEYKKDWYVNYNYEFEPLVNHAQEMLGLEEWTILINT